MSLKLTWGIEVLVGIALAAMVLALLPAPAEAQEVGSPSKQDARGAMGGADTRLTSVVVSPGDSLWSLSAERLGPNASPRQIAEGVERIYALNRGQIGDPDLIYSGQILVLPPASESPRAARQVAERRRGSAGDGDPERTLKASRAPRGADTERVALPDLPAEQPAPKVSATDAPSAAESLGKTARRFLGLATSATVGASPQDDLLGRKLLGWGIIALTILIVCVMAWKLPLNRGVRAYEVWGLPRDDDGTYPTAGPARKEEAPGLALDNVSSETDSGSFGGETPSETSAVEDNSNGVEQASPGTRKQTTQPRPLPTARWEETSSVRKQILVVVNHGVFREAFALVLQFRMDLEVAQAGTLDEARRVLRTPHFAPNLAVVDLELPNGEGVDLIGEIFETWPQVSVLALTFGQDLERASRAKVAGAEAVLSMTASSEELLEGVRRLENS